MDHYLAKHLTKQVAEFYQAHGFAFARTRGMVWEEEREAAECIEPGMRVYDIGAGNGRFARLVQKGATYIGVEPSETLRAHAMADAFLCAGGFPHLPVADNVSDVTVCFAVFHHLPGTEARRTAVEELIRITKPGGIIIATSWAEAKQEPMPTGEGDPGDGFVAWKEGGSDAKRYVHLMQPGEWESLWNDSRLAHTFIGKRRPQNWFIMTKKN